MPHPIKLEIEPTEDFTNNMKKGREGDAGQTEKGNDPVHCFILGLTKVSLKTIEEEHEIAGSSFFSCKMGIYSRIVNFDHS